MKGYQIDSIIRQHLWAGGFDFPGVATGHGVTHGLGVVEGGASISSTRTADQSCLREGMIMTIGIFPPKFGTDSRTRSVSTLAFRDAVGKRIRRHCFGATTIHATTSNFGTTAQVLEIGDAGLYPLPTKHDNGRFDDTTRNGYVTELSFEMSQENSKPMYYRRRPSLASEGITGMVTIVLLDRLMLIKELR